LKTKTKILTITLAVVLLSSILAFTPIIPVKAQITEGTTAVTPEIQRILTIGNYCVAFDLSNFAACWDGLNVTADKFTVNANTHTEANQTTGYLIINLYNAHIDIADTASLTLGEAQLKVDLHMEDGYISYTCYTDTTTSFFELAQNAIANLT